MGTTKLPPAVDSKAKRGPGRYGLGGGLYLHVRKNGARGWAFRYRDRVTHKLREKGLGTFPDVTLAAARVAATDLRRELQAGLDPIDSSRQAREAERLDHSRRRTFGDCCDAYIAAHKAGWRNPKHRDQWRNTLDTYAANLLPLPVQTLDTTSILAVLEPIWTEKTETATRVRQRMEAVLDWATVRGYRSGENPARWRGHLSKLLVAPAKVKKVKHHAALPYAKLSDFMATLAEIDTLARMALRMQIFTATRPSETVAAQWSEIDLGEKVWTIPPERMKAHNEHRVPLSPELVQLLTKMPGRRTGYVFPGKPGRPITIAATLAVVKELQPGLTAHGFRSTFRDWAGDCTSYPRDVAEAALAHVIKDKTEAAYRRSDMLARRAALMADWARFCCATNRAGAKVTSIRRNESGASR